MFSMFSKADNDKPIDLVSMGVVFATFVTAWIVFYSIKMPPNWLGGMDGYFYASMMKTYLNQFGLAAIDPASPMNYPQYFFYLMGMIGRIFQETDLGKIAWMAHLLSYAMYSALSFLLFRIVVGTRGSVVIQLLSYAFYFSSWGFEHVWEKPHEIATLPGIAAAFVYVAMIAGAKLSVRDRLFAGTVLGFSLGSYTPFMVVPVLSIGAVVFIECMRRVLHKEPLFLKGFYDSYYFVPAIVVSLPYWLTIAFTVLTHDHGMGHVPAAFLHNLKYEFLEAGAGSVVYFMAIFLAAAGLVALAVRRKLNYYVLYACALVLIGVALFAVVVWAYQFGFKHTSPFKYIIHIPLVLAIMVVVYAQSISGRFSEKFRNSAQRILTAAIVVGSFVIPNYLMHKLFHSTHYKTSYNLFEMRSRNVGHLVADIVEMKKTRRLEYYFGNFEAMFINAMIPGKFVSYIMFNESYASVYENVQKRAKDINDVAGSGDPVRLYDYFKNAGVDILILAHVASGNYKIMHSTTVGEEVQRPNYIVIPKRMLDALVAKKRMEYRTADGYDMYVLN